LLSLSREKLSTKCQELITQVVMLKAIQNKIAEVVKINKLALLLGFISSPYYKILPQYYYGLCQGIVKNI